ncbi:DUF5032 domain-containing protein [Parabacteroides sp.]
MKKYLFLLLIGAVSLTACGDDDDPVVPELNKLTKVSCYKDGSSSPLFTADVNYTADGKISGIRFSGDKEWRLVSSDNKYLMIDLSTGNELGEYVLSGNVITAKNVLKKNSYASNEVYVSDEYKYVYSGSNLTLTSWLVRWPNKDGKGYKSESYNEYDRFYWENGNVVTFTRNQDQMEYEYSVAEMPANFPLRVIGSFAPVGFEAVSPLNLLYGARNRNLPTRAYTYTIPNQSEVKAEYKYTYTTVGDYITGMTIDENDGGTENAYKYTFEYDFEVK